MKPPKLIADLYGDLRDRKLLPLVVVLLVATAALPLILGSDAAAPPVSDEAMAEELPEGVPAAAVLVSDPGLRDYRERLDELRAKDPFAGQSTAETESTTADTATTAPTDVTTASSGGSTDSASFSESFSETVTESASSSGTTTESAVPAPVDDSSDSTVGDTGGSTESSGGSRWFTFSVDVLTGPAGDTHRRNNLQTLTVLPSESNPVAVYIGVAEGGKKAVFMVSPDVVDNSGPGSCLPSPSTCQFLMLKKGDEQKLDYAPQGEADTFVIDVKDIRFEEVKDPEDVTGSEDPKRSKKGLSAFAGD